MAYRAGEPGYRRITAALFAAGLATFASMYALQGVLPSIAAEFRVSPACAALTVSATTGALAAAIVPASILSERFGRTRVMALATTFSALLGMVAPLLHNLDLIIALRALQGVTLAGVPAVAMAYLAEEVHPDSLGAAMGRYIAGTSIGGLSGRLIATTCLEWTSWRWAIEAAFGFALAMTLFFVKTAPRSRYFSPKPIGVRQSVSNVAGHLTSPKIVSLVIAAFLLMGSFVSVFNVLGFRLIARPFALSPALAGSVFLLYLAGTFTAAWAGRLTDRFTRLRVFLVSVAVMLTGLLLTLPDSMWTLLPGMLMFTGGFFAAHACASGGVSALATTHRAEASGLYLFGYYAGSSILGALAGIPYSQGGWSACVSFVSVAIVAAAGIVSVMTTPRFGRLTK